MSNAATTGRIARTVAQIVPSLKAPEGGGVTVRRTFPTTRLEQVDPFLLLDEMGPWDITPGQAAGFPDHPHRGFETVTYLLEGQMEHRDSFGHHGVIGPGEVQWMTAGSGLVHSEMAGAELIRNGGRLHGFQTWVNLPQRQKMTAPRYQELKASEIPIVEKAGVKARVIAGSALGARGAVQTNTPITYIHLTLAPGSAHTQAAPRTQNALVYVISGESSVGDHAGVLNESRAAVFAHDGDEVRLSNPAARPLDVLFLAGEPLNEPVARYGPFVMNTREELYQAFEDFREGRMGVIL
jgi:redox-sensitive bicupin YhaK (pirin superfamily)